MLEKMIFFLFHFLFSIYYKQSYCLSKTYTIHILYNNILMMKKESKRKEKDLKKTTTMRSDYTNCHLIFKYILCNKTN